MKLHLLNRKSEINNSFSVAHHRSDYFLKVWHHHPELELVLIVKSSGSRFVADDVQQFKEGEVVLLGKDLPHMWLNDDPYFKKNNRFKAEAVSVHFKEDFLGSKILEIPEFKPIKSLFVMAKRGLVFRDLPESLKRKILDLVDLQAFERTHSFLNILYQLAKSDKQVLASDGFMLSLDSNRNSRLLKIHEFIATNFHTTIKVEELARICGMNTSSFSRYFRRMHQKTFTRYLNELRVGYACKLLIQDDHKISTICFECGFNNLSNFNRQFRSIKGCSPRDYKRKYTMGAGSI